MNSRHAPPTATTGPTWHAPYLLRALRSIGFGGVIGTGLWALQGQSFAHTMAYSLSISLSCWFLIDTGRLLVARWLWRRSGAPGPADGHDWPGWQWMIGIVLIGSCLGFTMGTALVNGLTGSQSPNLIDAGNLRQALSLLLLALVPAIAITYFFYSRGLIADREAETLNAQRQAAEHQLKLLESQLEPHMLFNTLANLRVLIGMDPARAQTMLDQLIAFLRATLSGSRVAQHPLRAEFARLADYLALMQVRMGDRLQARFDLPEALAGIAVPPLLLQPLIENCIKHGLEPAVAGGRIDIGAARDGADLVLSVRDTGAGLSTTGVAGTTFGLVQVRERLAALYGTAASLSLRNADGAEGGTLATIRLPLPRAHAAMNASALIAEDEPLLAENLQAELLHLWPALQVVANVRSGDAAVEHALALRPDVVFLDIRMPGLNGLEAAQAIAEDWLETAPLPLIVFVTAYDQYALQAFERSAIDYVLKPVQRERLAHTCARLQTALKARDDSAAPAPAALEATLAQLRSLLAAPGLANVKASADAAQLSVIQASVGAAIHMVPIGDVLYFEAADKYVRVITAEREYLIRTSLRELVPQLDAQRFWQIHRGTVVRADAVATALRDESGKVHLSLRGHKDKLVASRLYAHLFKAM